MTNIHRLSIRVRYGSGAEEWVCSECGFAFVTTGKGGLSILLGLGDTGVRHEGPNFHLDYIGENATPYESEDDFWNDALDGLIE